MKPVIVSGGFDDLRASHVRFLEEAAQLGEVTALVWPDAALLRLTGNPPKFPLAERLYFLNAIRYIARTIPLPRLEDPNQLPELDRTPAAIWVDGIADANDARARHARARGIEYRVLTPPPISEPAAPPLDPKPTGRRKVVVTGCYDWFHSGHVRFFEEVSTYGDLYVIVGHDANIRLLKGEGHPLLPQAERRYVVGAIRHVKQALISTGEGWLDADPEIRALKPDIYAVNEDGDRGGKREYCARLGIEYLVLKREPAPGLTRRSSTQLRGF